MERRAAPAPKSEPKPEPKPMTVERPHVRRRVPSQPTMPWQDDGDSVARAGSIECVDFDPKAIAYANRNFRAGNVTYRVADIRTAMPEGEFDNIIWDAAIEHFTEAEIANLMINIKKRLTASGILSGHTIVEQPDGQKMLHHHEYEFKSKEDLARFFRPHFRNVKVFETIFPDRRNLYFWASDGVIPFMAEWPAATG
jgi:SAM-dependent methyltransferase